MSSAEPHDPAILAAGYRLVDRVARGGMGEIWRATALSDGRTVAVKRILLDPGGVGSTELTTRLIREAEIIARLEHEHVVRYIDAGLDAARRPFLVLEWLEGESLAARLSRAPPDLKTSVDLARQALAGLGACHAQGIVHRDVKPANLFLVDGDAGPRLKLLDLGVALVETTATRLTEAGAIVGTLHYLSPEQARGVPHIDQRSDLYAVGVVLYQLCTGRLPFDGHEPLAVLIKILTETPPRVRQIRPSVPAWLDEVILRALMRAASDRYGSAAEMAAALDRPLEDDAPRLSVPVFTGAESTADTLLGAGSSMEYRMVCLLCVEAPDDPALRQTAVAAIGDAGGIAQELLGGVVVGLFGVERSLGDEAMRCVTAGLRVRDAALGAARLLAATVHVEVGAGLQIRPDDLDHALVKLGRLPPNKLIVDRPTRQLAGPAIVTAAAGAHDSVIGLAGPEEGQRRVLGVATPLIGREPDLAALRAAFYRAAENGEREVVLVVGPAGIGKTRLVAELRGEMRERSALLLEGRADTSSRRAPGGLVAAALGQAAGIRAGLSSEEKWKRLDSLVRTHAAGMPEDERLFLGIAIGLEAPETMSVMAARSDSKLMLERVASGVQAFLAAAAGAGPIAIALDDLHLEDDFALASCERLLGRLEEHPIFVVVTARDDLLERRPRILEDVEPTRIELKPLRRRSLTRLAEAILRDRPSPAVDAEIAQWSGGNPYLVEELLGWLVSHEAIVLRPEGWTFVRDPKELGLPVAVEAALQGRIDRLGPGRKELLKCSAVFGISFWEEGLAALGASAAPADLKALDTSDFIIADASTRIAGTRQWSFRHGLTQQVAYQLLPPARRAELHGAAARWLEAQGESDPRVLGTHFERAGEMTRAMDFFAVAGAQAMGDGDPQGAVGWFERSIGEELPEAARIERMTGLGAALIAVARYAAARAKAEELLRMRAVVDRPAWQARALWLKGRALRAVGENSEAVATLEAARGLLLDQPASDLRFDIDQALFWSLWALGDYAGVGRLAPDLRALAEALGRPDQMSASELASAYYHTLHGDLSASVGLAERAAEHAREVQHRLRELEALLPLASVQAIVGRYQDAEATAERAAALARRMRRPYYESHVASLRGYLGLLRDRPADARANYATAVECARAIGDARGEASARAGLARAIARSTGPDRNVDEAAAEAMRAIELAAGNAQALELEGRLAATEAFRAKGEPQRAVEHALAAIALLDLLGAQEQFEIEILLAARDALASTGRTADAAALLERAQRRLAERAEKIADPEVRTSYLFDVPHNRRVAELRGER